jgi:hypothetical protein
MAEKTNLDFNQYTQLAAFLRAQRTGGQLDVEMEPLFQELEKLELAIKSQLYLNRDEETVDQLHRRLLIIEKMLNISVSPQELAHVRADNRAFSIASVINTMAQFPAEEMAELKQSEWQELENRLDQAKQFYALADQRSQAIVTNLIQTMQRDHQKFAVLITGGFHTPHILSELKDLGVTTINIRPRLEHEDVINPYFNILKQCPNPLEKLLMQNQNNLSTVPVTAATKDPLSALNYLVAIEESFIGTLQELTGIVAEVEANGIQALATSSDVETVTANRNIVIVKIGELGRAVIQFKPITYLVKALKQNTLAPDFEIPQKGVLAQMTGLSASEIERLIEKAPARETQFFQLVYWSTAPLLIYTPLGIWGYVIGLSISLLCGWFGMAVSHKPASMTADDFMLTDNFSKYLYLTPGLNLPFFISSLALIGLPASIGAPLFILGTLFSYLITQDLHANYNLWKLINQHSLQHSFPQFSGRPFLSWALPPIIWENIKSINDFFLALKIEHGISTNEPREFDIEQIEKLSRESLNQDLGSNLSRSFLGIKSLGQMAHLYYWASKNDYGTGDFDSLRGCQVFS